MSFFDRLLGRQTDDYSVLVATAQVGELCANWLTTDVGKYVTGRAEEYEMEVLRELASTPPGDKFKIMQLQERAKVPALLIRFMDDAISDGEAARFQIESEEKHE